MSPGSRSKSGNKAEPLAPGEHLRAEIARLGLDQVAVSKATGVSRQSINNIINGRQTVSRAMAGKLGRLTGHTSDYWLSAFFSDRGAARQAINTQLSGLLTNHQIIRAVEDGIVRIDPFVSENVRAARVDLTLAKGVTLSPGMVVASRTKERIELPRDYLGRIGIVGELSGIGMFAAHAFQLEPGFKGQIGFCLYNAGTAPFRLHAGDIVLGLEIVRLSAAPN